MYHVKKSFADFSESINNVDIQSLMTFQKIQLMREQIEKTIEEEEVIKRKLKNNQPLFVEKKKKERYFPLWQLISQIPEGQQ